MKVVQTVSMSLTLAACLLAAASSPALAQASKVVATQKDVAYNGAHAAQKLDVYLAQSDAPLPAMIFIHGGGWRGGSKNSVPGWLMNAVRDRWLSVVSVEYRFTDVGPHPAQVNDCLRAITSFSGRPADAVAEAVRSLESERGALSWNEGLGQYEIVSEGPTGELRYVNLADGTLTTVRRRGGAGREWRS